MITVTTASTIPTQLIHGDLVLWLSHLQVLSKATWIYLKKAPNTAYPSLFLSLLY